MPLTGDGKLMNLNEQNDIVLDEAVETVNAKVQQSCAPPQTTELGGQRSRDAARLWRSRAAPWWSRDGSYSPL